MKSAIYLKGRFTRLAALMMPVLLFVALTGRVSANNISVSNVTYITGASDYVQFDLSWENSWRNTGSAGSTLNYDGAWVFVKFRHACADDSLNASSFQHMWLSTTTSDHSIVTPGATIEVGTTTISSTARGMGVFIYRSADGSGNLSLTGVKLKWDKTAQAISGTDWDIKVYALEMVYIPAASFYAGDGSSSYYFYTYPTTTSPFKVTAENAVINCGTTAGYLYSGTTLSVGSGSLPAGFPKGYGPYWMMKYEVTQQQYVDFLNSLSRTLQSGLVFTSSLGPGAMTTTNTYVMSATSTLTNRNGIRCASTFHSTKPITFFCDLNGNGTGNEIDDGMTIACNYLGYSNYFLLKYLDWSALRPMSELEFEKACRGSDAVYGGLISSETPCSLNGSIAGNYTYVNGVTNAGKANEASSLTGIGLIHAGNLSPSGPRRVGSTYTGSTDRIYSGSSYYGPADLGGNVMEYVVRVNISSTFLRTDYGDGVVGSAYPATWTPYPGYRGGSWAEAINYCAISDRYYVQNYTTPANNYFGGRGCR